MSFGTGSVTLHISGVAIMLWALPGLSQTTVEEQVDKDLTYKLTLENRLKLNLCLSTTNSEYFR